jgi:hypothetical protein
MTTVKRWLCKIGLHYLVWVDTEYGLIRECIRCDHRRMR